MAQKKLEVRPECGRVSDVFETDEDAPLLERAGIQEVLEPRFKRYSQRLARLRAIRMHTYRMDVLERISKHRPQTILHLLEEALADPATPRTFAVLDACKGKLHTIGAPPRGIGASLAGEAVSFAIMFDSY